MYSPILGGCDYSIRVVNILNRLRRMIKHEKIKERESNEPCPCSICSNVLKRCKDSHLDLHLNDVSHPSPLEKGNTPSGNCSISCSGGKGWRNSTVGYKETPLCMVCDLFCLRLAWTYYPNYVYTPQCIPDLN